MRIQVYCDKLPVGAGILVVNETSADPGLQGVIPVPVDEESNALSPRSSALPAESPVEFLIPNSEF
jgi:hypothetical protein